MTKMIGAEKISVDLAAAELVKMYCESAEHFERMAAVHREKSDWLKDLLTNLGNSNNDPLEYIGFLASTHDDLADDYDRKNKKKGATQ